MIPKYINCQENTEVCDYLMTKECKNICPYVKSLGIGACCDSELFGRLEKEINEDENLLNF